MVIKMRLRIKKRLYISEWVKVVLGANFVTGILSLIGDIIGLYNLSFSFAILSFCIGGVDFSVGLILLRKYLKERKG